jgi:hypothetical protein
MAVDATMRSTVSAPEFPSDARMPPRREDHYVLEDLPAQDRMLWGSLAYIFFPVSIYYARWDPFVRFHARQAVGLALCWVASWYLSGLAWSYEVPELGVVGYVVTTLMSCDGIYRALSLKKRSVRGLGFLFDKIPLPKKLAE